MLFQVCLSFLPICVIFFPKPYVCVYIYIYHIRCPPPPKQKELGHTIASGMLLFAFFTLLLLLGGEVRNSATLARAASPFPLWLESPGLGGQWRPLEQTHLGGDPNGWFSLWCPFRTAKRKTKQGRRYAHFLMDLTTQCRRQHLAAA